MKAKGFILLSAILMITMCLAVTASAEIVGRTADGYIHRYTADNGQEIYFVSIEKEPPVRYEDVNFDGHPDLVMVTALGASNAYYEFYLWNGSEYEYAEHWIDDIINYELVDGQYLVSRSNDGNAGTLFHAEICVWDGNVLKSIRTIVSEEETSIVWEGRIGTQTTNLDRLHVTVWEADSLVGEATVLWEKTYNPSLKTRLPLMRWKRICGMDSGSKKWPAWTVPARCVRSFLSIGQRKMSEIL